MDITKIVEGLRGCQCGRAHEAELRAVEIGHGIRDRAGEIMEAYGLPKKVFIVADKNTLAASEGVLQSLERSGYKCGFKIYDNLRRADIIEVNEIRSLFGDAETILSIGTGSLNDICRHGCYLDSLEGKKRAFAIFATAPSMDGFASGTAPITVNSFKITRPGIQPSLVMADTAILAASPAYLKSAGFGDMIAKYIALCDWRISTLLTGEYYCERVAALTREALRRITALADRVTLEDEETAGAIMEALVFTGIAMKLADTVRPASGSEHMISHFWEMKKLERGFISDFHGKKVGIATLYIARLYHKMAEQESISAHPDLIDWDELTKAYGESFIGDVRKMNEPCVTGEFTPEKLESSWPEIRRIVKEEIPTPDELLKLMKSAGAATHPSEVEVDDALARDGFIYHSYMRRRLSFSRIVPMIDGCDKIRDSVIALY